MIRRGFVATLGSAVAGFFAARTAEAARPWPEVPPKRRVLATTRMVNTLQYYEFRTSERYLSYSELLASTAIGTALEDGPDFFDLRAARHGEEPIPGFAVSLLVAADRKRYTLLIQEKATGFGYLTDESGLIQEGWVQPVDGAFLGSPLAPPRRLTDQSLRARLRRVAYKVQNLVLPSAQASCCGGDAWCQSAQCAPAGHCYEVCSATCCNLGYTGCIWCCTGNQSCACTRINCS